MKTKLLLTLLATGLGGVAAAPNAETSWPTLPSDLQRIGHSPALFDQTLFFGSMGRRLYAVPAGNGKEIWNYEFVKGSWTSPLVYGRLVMHGARDENFHPVHAYDGEGALAAATRSAIATKSLPPESKVISLFNRTNLSGLYTWLVDTKYEDPRRVFTVTNGMLRISGEGLGYIATQDSYSDYLLRVEFQWGHRNWAWGDRIGKARDSGIFLHSVGPDGNSHDGQGAFRAAIECNLFQGATGDFLLIRGNAADGSLLSPRLTAEVAEARDADNWPFWKKGGARVRLERWGRLNWFGKDPQWQDRVDFRGANDVEKPPGEWNLIESICRSNRIQIWLNGVLVNEAFEVWPTRGPILLQCEGSEIFVRKFELQLLE